MKTAKFNVPEEVVNDFLDAATDKELVSQVVSKTEDDYLIEIDYEQEDASDIDDLEEELTTLIENIEDEEEEEETEE